MTDTPRKFRVWDPDEENMFEPPHNFYLDGDGDVHHEEIEPQGTTSVDIRVMYHSKYVASLYTGLTDDDGIDIYEGDIIEKDTGGRIVMDVVYWDVDGWAWDGKDLWLATQGLVTGNQYEDLEDFIV